jgi:hypothetical protein
MICQTSLGFGLLPRTLTQSPDGVNHATIASLVVQVLADTAELRTGMAQAVDIVEGMSSSMLSTITVGNLLSDGFEKLGEMGLQAVTAIAEAIPELVGHTIDLENQIFEMSMKTGASVETLSALRYVASQSGMDFDALTTSFFKVETALGSTGPKADKLAASLENVGLDMQNLKNSSPDEAFIEIVSALENVGNAADRNALAMQLFGRGAKDMAGLFHEDIYAMLQDAQDLGLVVSTSDAAAAHAADVGWQSFSMQIEAVAMKIASLVLPALVALEQLASQAFQTLVTQYQQAGAAFSQTQIRDAIVQIGEAFIQGIAAAAGFAQGAIEGLSDVTAFAIRTGEAVLNIALALNSVVSVRARLEQWAAQQQGITVEVDKTKVALEGAYQALEALKAPLNEATGLAQRGFKAVEDAANSMAGRFGAAYDTASATITDFADKSKSAGDVVASTIADTLSPGMKAFEKAVDDVNSAGLGWQGTLDTIDGAVVENMRDLNAAGVSIKTLETYYGLTAAQGKAFTDMLKDEQTQLKLQTSTLQEVTKLWDDYDAVVASDSGSAYDKAAGAIDKWYGDLVAKYSAAGKDTADFYAAVGALDDAKYAHLTLTTELQDKNSRASFQKQADDAESTYQFMLDHADQYVQGDIALAQKDAQAKIDAMNHWADLATAAIDRVSESEVTAASLSKIGFQVDMPGTTADSIAAYKARNPIISSWLEQGYSMAQAMTLVEMGQAAEQGFFSGNILQLIDAIPKGPAVPGFLAGGPTTEGLGYLHDNEYVVPSGGALVRGGGGGGGPITVNLTMSGVMTSDKAALLAAVDKTVVAAVKSLVKLGAV